jgi:hypothetical protein
MGFATFLVGLILAGVGETYELGPLIFAGLLVNVAGFGVALWRRELH